jgi:hypothetical protein
MGSLKASKYLEVLQATLERSEAKKTEDNTPTVEVEGTWIFHYT